MVPTSNEQQNMQASLDSLPLDLIINRANTLQISGNLSEARDLYIDWIKNNDTPQKFVALFNLGVICVELGEIDAAEKAYKESINYNPRLIQASLNLGLVYERKGQIQQALELWNQVAYKDLEVNPEFRIFALNNMARVYETLGQYEETEKNLLESLKYNKKQPAALQHIVSSRQKMCKWPIITDLPNNRAHDLLDATSALSMLAISDEPAMQWLAATSTIYRKFNLKEEYLCIGKTYSHKKIRIGYLSGDLCTHAVGLLMADLLENHDKNNFEIFAYDFSPEDRSEHRIRLKKAFDQFIDIKNKTDQEVAFRILNDEIDVLIDLHGWSSGARPGVFALHPAKVQITFLGYFGTTASSWIDYVITDKFVFYDGLAPFFSEEPLFVEGTVIPLSYNEFVPTKLSRETYGISNDAFVYACFNNINKVNPDIFAVWMNILKRTQNTILWLLDDNQWSTYNLKAEAEKHGMLNRLYFAPRTNFSEYRERMQLADIFLDTFPYNAGSTARDVIDMKLPILTCAGATPMSRVAGSLLHSLDLGDLVSENLLEYENKAIELAAAPEKIKFYRNHLLSLSESLRDRPKRFIASLETQISKLIS